MHLADKLKLLSDGAAEMMKRIESEADTLIAKRGDLEVRAIAAIKSHTDVLGIAEKGIAELEKAVQQITNGGPTGG